MEFSCFLLAYYLRAQSFSWLHKIACPHLPGRDDEENFNLRYQMRHFNNDYDSHITTYILRSCVKAISWQKKATFIPRSPFDTTSKCVLISSDLFFRCWPCLHFTRGVVYCKFLLKFLCSRPLTSALCSWRRKKKMIPKSSTRLLERRKKLRKTFMAAQQVKPWLTFCPYTMAGRPTHACILVRT